MLKKYKPTSPGRRGMTSIDYSVLTKKKPEKRKEAPATSRLTELTLVVNTGGVYKPEEDIPYAP